MIKHEKRLLIVDDDRTIVYTLKKILSREGYLIETAYSPEEALTKVETFAPQVMLLDIRMPAGEEGIEVLKAVKSGKKEIEIIMLTALAEIELAVRSLKSGAFNYIAKPWDSDMLREIVKKAFYFQQLQTELTQKTEQAQKIFSVSRALAGGNQDHVCLIRDTGEAMCQIIPGQVCNFIVIEGANDLYEVTLKQHRASFRVRSIDDLVRLEDLGIGEQLNEHKPIIIEHPVKRGLEALFGMQAACRIKTIISIPLRFGGDLIGFIIMYLDNKPDYFEDEKLPLLNYADSIATIINTDKLIRKIQAKTEELIARKKDLELGNLFAQIIHRISQIVGPLRSYTQSDNPADQEEMLKLIKNLIDTTDSMKQYTQGMQPEPRFVLSDLAGIVEASILENHRRLAEQNIRVIRQFQYDKFQLIVEPEGLRTLFSNLIANAADSFLLFDPEQPRQIWINIENHPSKPFICINIRDNGKGIRDEIQNEIYDPFISTKQNGIGLGLSIVRNILETHRGEIQFSSKINAGTEFTVHLPLREGETIAHGNA